MNATPPVVAVLLAAGAGSRFRDVGHKLTARLPATPARPAESVASRALSVLEAAAVGPIVVVIGATELTAELDGRDVVVVTNPEWAAGQMTSVRAGVAAAGRLGASRACIGLADQPGIDPAAWRAVAEADAPIAVATYDGRRANPVMLREDVWGLLPQGGDEGA